jgi:hypothetical protein
MNIVATTVRISTLLAVCIVSFGIISCERRPTEPELEEVLPNVVTLTLTDAANASSRVSATWRSTANATTAMGVRVDTLVLAAGRTYNGIVTATNDLKTPNVDLTDEYRSLANEHQFFYTVSGDAAGRVRFQITDRDGNNLPLGLQYTVAVSTGATVRGTLNVVLGHYDPKEGKRKDGTTRSPESDIDINIPLVVR